MLNIKDGNKAPQVVKTTVDGNGQHVPHHIVDSIGQTIDVNIVSSVAAETPVATTEVKLYTNNTALTGKPGTEILSESPTGWYVINIAEEIAATRKYVMIFNGNAMASTDDTVYISVGGDFSDTDEIITTGNIGPLRPTLTMGYGFMYTSEKGAHNLKYSVCVKKPAPSATSDYVYISVTIASE